MHHGRFEYDSDEHVYQRSLRRNIRLSQYFIVETDNGNVVGASEPLFEDDVQWVKAEPARMFHFEITPLAEPAYWSQPELTAVETT